MRAHTQPAMAVAGWLLLVTAAGGAYGQQGGADTKGGTNSTSGARETAGLTVTPYVSLATLYDDNIFASASQRESDTILRLTPGIMLDYRTPRTRINFSYSDDAERYARHSDLNSWQSRQTAGLSASHAFNRRISAGLDANYFETQYPGELAPVSGIELTRRRATAISFRPTATYHFNERTDATVYYERLRTHDAGGQTNFTTTASAALARDLTRRDRLVLTYRYDWFDFSNGNSPVSRVVTLGWHHDLSRSTSFFLAAGPRDTNSRTVADVSAGIRSDAEKTTAELYVTRSQVALPGLTGVYDTRAVQGYLAYRFSPRLSVEVTPGYYRDTGAGQEAEVYRLGVGMRYWFSPAWSIGLNYDYGRQRGTLGSVGNGDVIRRNVAALTISWALPQASGPAAVPSQRRYRPPPQVFKGD